MIEEEEVFGLGLLVLLLYKDDSFDLKEVEKFIVTLDSVP